MKAATEKKVKTVRRNRLTAADKCRAVLALWTQRSSGTELCRELGTTWNMLSLWQELAMEGMLQALEPKRSVPGLNAPLNPRLQSLLERQAQRKAAAQDSPGPEPEMRRQIRRKPETAVAPPSPA